MEQNNMDTYKKTIINNSSIKKIFVSTLFLFLSLLYFLVGCIAESSVYAFKINSEEISLGEFKMYLYEQKKLFEQKGGEDIWETDFDGVPAEDVAKQNAVNSIVMVKAAVKQSSNFDIALNESEKEKVRTDAEEFYTELREKTAMEFELTVNDIYEILCEGEIQKKVFNYITDGFEISEADFNSYFNNYYEKNKSELNEVLIRYIFKSTESSRDIKETGAEVEKIYLEVLNGEDFSKLQNVYSDSTEKGIVEMEIGLFEPDVENAVYNLETGEISPIIQTGDGFYIIKAENVKKPDMNQLKESIKDTYINEKKQEIYQKQNQKWVSEYNIQKNEELWQSIKVNTN